MKIVFMIINFDCVLHLWRFIVSYKFKSREWLVKTTNGYYLIGSIEKPKGDLVFNITDVDFVVRRKGTCNYVTYKNTENGKNLILYEDGVKKWTTEWCVESLVFDGYWEVVWCRFDNNLGVKIIDGNLQSIEGGDKSNEVKLTKEKKWFQFWK